jgi:hypothetical protein
MQNLSLPSSPARRNGNGAAYPAPTSRRAFFKSAPGRIGVLEDLVEAQDGSIIALEQLITALSELVERQDRELHRRLDAVMLCVMDVTDHNRQRAACLDALIITVGRQSKRLGRVDRRSARTRRRLAAVIADHLRATPLS